MITVSVRNLVEAIRDAEPYDLPEMNDGTEYLYHSVYDKLAREVDVMLNDIDFTAFEPEDVDSLSDLHSDVFERNHYVAGKRTAKQSKLIVYVGMCECDCHTKLALGLVQIYKWFSDKVAEFKKPQEVIAA